MILSLQIGFIIYFFYGLRKSKLRVKNIPNENEKSEMSSKSSDDKIVESYVNKAFQQ